MKRLLMIGAICSLIALAGCSAQKAGSTPEEIAATKQLAESRQYTIEAYRAIPSGGRSVNLTRGDYALRIDGNTVNSHLPYFGRAYSAPYGGGEGLIFDGTIENYTARQTRRGSMDISFRVRTPEDTYDYKLDIFPDGSSTISVDSNNKRSITFYGNIQNIER